MKVYMTKYNADLTEGRGPMVNDKCFLHWNHAARYINSQPGVMGRTAKWTDRKYGDWEIEEIEVIDYDILKEQERINREKKAALNKLSDYEKKILGL